MKTTSLSDLKEQCAILNRTLLEKDAIIANLQEQLNWFKNQIFGKKSERIVKDLNTCQMEFEGFGQIETKEEAKTTVPTHQRKKPNRNGKDAITIPDDLPVETVILDIPEEEKICPETKQPLTHIGNETSYKLAHKPGSYFIKEIIRPKYAHPQKPELGILTRELPDSIIPKCRADESLLAEIITQKFANPCPFIESPRAWKEQTSKSVENSSPNGSFA